MQTYRQTDRKAGRQAETQSDREVEQCPLPPSPSQPPLLTSSEIGVTSWIPSRGALLKRVKQQYRRDRTSVKTGVVSTSQ